MTIFSKNLLKEGDRVQWNLVDGQAAYGTVIKIYGQEDDLNDTAVMVRRDGSFEPELKLLSDFLEFTTNITVGKNF